MFRKLKRSLFPSRYILKEIRKLLQSYGARLDAIQAHQQEVQAKDREKALVHENKVLVNQNRAIYFSNLGNQEHIRNILSAEEPSDDDISFTLQLATRQIDFRIENPDLSRPIVCTVALGKDYKAKVASCIESQRDYCLQHGYPFVELVTPPDVVLRTESWYKIALLYSLLKQGYRDVCFIDADAMITNRAIRMETFFDRLVSTRKSLLIAMDESGMNMGVFFLRNSPSILRLLDLIWSYDVDLGHRGWEQNALRELVDAHRILQKIILIAERPRDFNSFPPERIHLFDNVNKIVHGWEEGDFICHFSGVRGVELESQIAKYAARATNA